MIGVQGDRYGRHLEIPNLHMRRSAVSAKNLVKLAILCNIGIVSRRLREFGVD